jgi:hypothetical protein
MKKLFDLVEFATEATHNENDGMGLFEALKDKPEALKLICQAIYEAKADYEHIKKFF